MVRNLSSVLICNTEVFNYEAWTQTVHLGLLSDQASNEP